MTAEKQAADVKRGASLDELAKRMVSIENSDDDLARMLANNWQSLLWVIILAGLAIVVFREFQSTREKKAGEIAQRFTEVQSDFRKAFEDKSGAPNGAAAIPALQENLRLLSTNYSDDVYGKLGKIYQAAIARREKRFDESRQALQAFPIQRLFTATQPLASSEIERSDMLTELAALQFVRVGLDEGKEPLPEIRKELMGLARSTRFLTAEALIALSRISKTPEEREEALSVARAVAGARGSLMGPLEKQLADEDIILNEQAASDAAAADIQTVNMPVEGGPIEVGSAPEAPEDAADDDLSN